MISQVIRNQKVYAESVSKYISFELEHVFVTNRLVSINLKIVILIITRCKADPAPEILNSSIK